MPLGEGVALDQEDWLDIFGFIVIKTIPAWCSESSWLIPSEMIMARPERRLSMVWPLVFISLFKSA